MRKFLTILFLWCTTVASGQSVIRANPYYVAKATVSGCSYLLDTYSGAAAAYSLRKLSSSYSGSAIRVRRSSDNTEQDIGFTGCGLDTASLKSFVGTGGADDGFIVKWYDQSGSSNDAYQTSAGNQPQIMDNGVIFRQGAMPTLKFDGTTDAFSLTSTLAINSDFSVFGVQARSSTGNQLFIFANSATGEPYNAIQFTDGNIYFTSNNTYVGGTDGLTGIRLLSSFRNSGALTLFRNGSSVTGLSGSVSGSTTYNYIGLRNGSNFANGNISEAIFYPSNKSSDRTSIESNINTYYTIF
ncbi:MAG: hypothetical protein IPQ08_06460 [Chitinophagaceae bacterium]|nr:hypothetical protein [Chitinophagaceae bacterium]